jgi:hypothetical protein
MDGREPWERLNKSLSKILLHIQEWVLSLWFTFKAYINLQMVPFP